MSLSLNFANGLGKAGMLKRGQILGIFEAGPPGFAGGLMRDVTE